MMRMKQKSILERMPLIRRLWMAVGFVIFALAAGLIGKRVSL